MKSTILPSLAFIFIGSLFTSCYKQKETVAVIKVVDANNQSVNNARVIVYGTGTIGTIVVNDTVFTDAAGEALFKMDHIYKPGQAGVAVLDIEVSKSGLSSQGIIKVEQEETTRETVRL